MRRGAGYDDIGGWNNVDWILLLSLTTFVLVIGFLLWTRHSTRRHHETGGKTSGIGGPNDPLSGAAEGMRHPDELRASLDEAATRVEPPTAHPEA